MKFITFILSIYILALNLTLCEDNSLFDNEVKIESSQATDNNHQHQGQDFCSPFCICQCCHVNAMHFKLVNGENNIPYISTQDFFYLNGIEKGFTTSILQPPRV